MRPLIAKKNGPMKDEFIDVACAVIIVIVAYTAVFVWLTAWLN